MADELTPKNMKMQTLIREADAGVYQIPVFQRSYVWKKSQVIKLMDSIFHNYPAGSLLILENSRVKGEEALLEHKSFKGADSSSKSCEYLVLDGQQRITSCYHVFYDKNGTYRYFIDLKKLYKEWKDASGDTELINFEECIVTENQNAKTYRISDDRLPFCLIRTLESYETHRAAYVDSLNRIGDDVEYINFINTKLGTLLDTFIDYTFTSLILPRNMNISAVCRIFETLNNTGLKLDSFDICVARFMRDKINIKDKLGKSMEVYSSLKVLFGNEKNREIPLQTIALIKTKNHLKNKLAESLDKSMITEYWDKAVKAIDETMKVLDTAGAGTLGSLKLLPYPAVIPVISATLVTTGYFGMSVSKRDAIKNKIYKYFYITAFNQRFNQGAASAIKEDYEELCNWFGSSNTVPKKIEGGVQWVDEIMGAVSNKADGAVSRAIRCVMNSKTPEDFQTKDKLKAFENNVDLHHLFPEKEYEKKFNNVNSLFNMAYLLKTTNESIGSDSTVRYSKKIIDDVLDGNESKFKEIMRTHIVDNECYNAFINEDYNLFIQSRMNGIISVLSDNFGIRVEKLRKADVQDEKISEIEEENQEDKLDL